MSYIDVHCHLDSLSDIERVIDRAEKSGVRIIVTQGINKETNRKSLDLASRFSAVKSALGFYPMDSLSLTIKEIDEEIKFIEAHKKDIIAIGEVGLDLKETNELEVQERVFQKMIDLSIKIGKPIIVHSRKAELQCIEQLEKNGAKKVLMHCFSGKISLVKRIIDNEWFLSIPTSVKNSQHFQEVIKLTPLEQLLCETDSPYLHPDKGFPNEPANVVESYKKIAEIKNLSLKDVEEQIEENYNRLF